MMKTIKQWTLIAGLSACLASVGEAQEETSKDGKPGSAKTGESPASVTQKFDLVTFEGLGYRMGEIFSIDSHLNPEEFEAVVRGLKRQWEDAGPPADYDSKSRQSELSALMTAHRKRSESKLSDMRADKARKNRAKGNAFFAELDAAGTTLKTEKGLRYMIIQKGSGKSPNPSNEVRFHLRGSHLNGDTYINTYKGNQPAVKSLQQLVPGLREGLQLIGEGGKVSLFVPPDLAYKDKGYGPIEPGETLTLEVELLEVINTAPPGPTEEATQQMRAQANKYFEALKQKTEKKDAPQ